LNRKRRAVARRRRLRHELDAGLLYGAYHGAFDTEQFVAPLPAVAHALAAPIRDDAWARVSPSANNAANFFARLVRFVGVESTPRAFPTAIA